jgi:hypothetical protein
MRAIQVLTRAAVPVAAVCALGLTGTAWASTAPAWHPGPPPPVSPQMCRDGHGHVVRDRNPHMFRCAGGRFSGRWVR